MKTKIILIIFGFFALMSSCLAAETINHNVPSIKPVDGDLSYPWSILLYRGWMTTNTLGQVLTFDYKRQQEGSLYAAELSYELSPDNPVREFFQPIVGTMNIALNTAYQEDPAGPVYELNPVLIFRWTHFPWNQYVLTTLGAGEGISYASRILSREYKGVDKTNHLLNFLMFEATFAMPSHPRWEFVWRLHHRSGAYNMYDAENSGSTAFGFGIRYSF